MQSNTEPKTNTNPNSIGELLTLTAPCAREASAATNESANAAALFSDAKAERLTRLQALAVMAVGSFVSVHTRRVYAARLGEYFASGCDLTREGVAEWLRSVRSTQRRGLGAMGGGAGSGQIHNQCLSAVKALVKEAEVRGLLDRSEAYAILQLKVMANPGVRTGNWLTLAGVQQLAALPDRSGVDGQRDAVLLALLLGCGLRCGEAVSITWKHWQRREGRGCLVDIMGKGRRVRTVPVPKWAEWDIETWRQYVVSKGWYAASRPIVLKLQRPYGNNLAVVDAPMGTAAAWHVMKRYAGLMGMDKLNPHDLRRTLARVMRKSGAEWEQIQLMLGHSKIETTQLYVGDLELTEGIAGVDMVDWQIGHDGHDGRENEPSEPLA